MSTSEKFLRLLELQVKLDSIWDPRKNLALSAVLFLAATILSISYLISFKVKSFRKGVPEKLSNNTVRIPQPHTLPIIGNVHHNFVPGVDRFKTFLYWALKYGKIYKLSCGWDDFYIINNPSMIQKILSSTNPHHLNRHRFIANTIFSSVLTGGLLNSEYNIWNPHRKIIARFFTYKTYLHQVKIINLHTKNMIKYLTVDTDTTGKNRRGAQQPADVGESVHHTSIRSILHLLMDSDLFSEEEGVDFHRKFQIGRKINARRIIQPWLLIKPIWNLHPLSKVLRWWNESMEDFVKTVLERFRAKRSTESNKETIEQNVRDKDEIKDTDLGVRKFKCIMEEMLDAGMTDKEILVESLTILFAGHDTTSTAMEFLLLRLALSPEHQERCREEVDELFERKTGSENCNPFDVDLSMDDLCQLKHVERCINENLRLLPTVPIYVRRLDEPLKLDDEIEPKAKSYIGIVPWTLHRIPEIWPDPERFDPDRFLPENVKKRHPYAYLPFSAGPRNCIGQKTALMQMKIMIGWILRFFEVHTTDQWEDITLTFGVVLDTTKKINLSFKPRNVTEKLIGTTLTQLVT